MKNPTAQVRILFCMVGLFASLTAPAILHAQEKGVTSDPSQTKITLKMQNKDIRDILRELFQAAKVNYLIDARIRGGLSAFSFEKVSFRIALETVLKRASESLTYSVENGIYVVELKEKPEDPLVDLEGYIITKIPSTFLNTSATAIVKLLKGMSSYISIVALPADNSILVRYVDNPEGHRAFQDFRKEVKLVDILPREVELRVEIVLVQAGKDSKSHKATVEMKGRTLSERAVKLQTNMQGQTITNSGLRISSSTYEFQIKPTINGNETVSLDAEASLDLTYRLPGDTRPQHLHNTYSGAGHYRSNTPMLLASISLKSQNSASSRGNYELRIYVTPILSQQIP